MTTPISRRAFLAYAFAASAVWAVDDVRDVRAQEDTHALFDVMSTADPATTFPQSVASGDPQPNGIVLWTRIAPQASAVRVAFEIAASPTFTSPVVRGVAATAGNRDWTVKTQITNTALRPNTTYYYRFIFNRHASRTGRFRTLPGPNANISKIRFACISCQDYTNGYYTALAHLANEQLDFVVHLGDYIYETVREDSFQNGQVRPLNLPSGRDRAETLSEYRFLYKAYRSDRNLQLVHERFAFINIWDDHEFANDSYGVHDTDSADPQANYAPQRREAANRAWAEYTPTGVPYNSAAGPLNELQIYRSFACGNLLELVMTDERLYRDAHPCGVSTTDKYVTPGCANRTNPNRTMLGATQKQWFLNKITTSPRTWKLWGNEVMVMQTKITNTFVGTLFPQQPRTDVFLNLDQWDGWPAERAHILRTIRNAGVKNFVTITGDIHSFIAGYQKVNFDDPLDAPVATCFVCGSITSANLEELATFGTGGPPVPRYDDLALALKASNPHIAFLNSNTHGYNLIEVTPAAFTCTMKAVNTIKQPQSTLYTLRTFQVPRDHIQIIDQGPTA